MVRDSYAFVCAILFAHFFSALPMLPVLVNGWDESSDVHKSMFVLGTLSDLGFDLYDATQMTYRTFFKHPLPIPFDFWFVMVVLHHTTAMVLVLPMNLYYVHRAEFHQTAVSLLMAAVFCYGAGNYKFSLDIGNKRRDFFVYKCIVMFQLTIILYTRVWLWFPAASSFRNHLKEQNDMVFFYGASIMIGIFSLFNVILVVDGFKAAFKCIPKKFPEEELEKEKTVRTLRRASGADFPMLGSPALEITKRLRARRQFRAAVKAVIAAHSMSSGISDHSKED